MTDRRIDMALRKRRFTSRGCNSGDLAVAKYSSGVLKAQDSPALCVQCLCGFAAVTLGNICHRLVLLESAGE